MEENDNVCVNKLVILLFSFLFVYTLQLDEYFHTFSVSM